MSAYVPPISIYPGDACSLEATYACGYDLIRNLNTIVACFNGVVVTIDACPGIGDPFPDYSCVYYAQTNSPFMMPYCVGGSVKYSCCSTIEAKQHSNRNQRDLLKVTKYLLSLP
ncbi:hypothetical protein BCR33DRAFT_199979 [Rhizoclosmatium globosum]|uniref:Uncharacterized protein n=1 Tax=Rhizoclosmatium globosum TaxID=329046 RepID=A0A1Y2AGH1_9FUNG|nr:hypothetical protein BCR33DRAFT_199979 [Rhizoclosmatium globosum]|eukprot:ORY21582.1 hypothetical protein BCR33DRAFT_199979 [Rhizoclosmatium globosum]